MSYRGRFAPSPSGPLHFGSLVAAMGSYLEALSHNGEWLVRIEDIDPPREVTGASRTILNTLESFGFRWHGPVLYQSSRYPAYQEALAILRRQEQVYDCICSRSQIQAAGHQGVEGVIYPGTCRHGLPPGTENRQRAVRLKTGPHRISVSDAVYGTIAQDLSTEIGDFILRRADHLYAYQLAVVVDDAFQEITHVVRGADLLSSTPRQIYLQQLLGYPTPHYLHLPLALNGAGKKLSKQSQSTPVDPANPLPALCRAYEFLGQTMPPEQISLDDFWEWAQKYWDSRQIGKTNRRV